MATKKDVNKVTRNIYFYDLVPIRREGCKAGNDVEAIINTFKEMEKIYKKFLSAKKNGNSTLANKLLNDIHFLTDRGDYLYVLVDEINDNIIKYRIVRCRTNALPFIDMDGELEKITKKINGKFDVAEVTHCVIFADKNLLGAEYNAAGARATSIAVIIGERKYDLENLKVLNKVNKDALGKLTDKKKFRLFELTIKNSAEIINKLVNKNIIGAAIGNFDFDTYTICIKRRITKKKDGFIPPFGVSEIEGLLEENGDQITKFVVDQGLYSKEINLLSDKMVVKRDFEYDEDERVLNSKNVYGGIINSAWGL